MAAAAASGALALMQEFLEQRVGSGHSPALMKALLINGARSLSGSYDFHVQNATNSQGWGLIHLPNSLPGALSNLNSGAIRIFDQSPANALATGQSQTRFFALSVAARSQPLRASLVWTDPPGNPAAGLKLVNDLDLVVTNLDTGQVFFGNDIPAASTFNLAWDTNAAPRPDLVNNVENVYLAPPLGTNYSITVLGRRVNVNAVTAHTNDVVQDYALVVSSSNGEIADALTLTEQPPTPSPPSPSLNFVTNAFVSSVDTSGALLFAQRLGAGSPLLGDSNGIANQWRFYVLTNDANFTNAAFATFLPSNLSLSPAGARQTNVANATRAQSDIDLYVSTNPGLTNLDPGALAAADKSLSRGGTELITYSNATPGQVYYIGVKSEDHQAAEYGFLALFSQAPFATNDAQGNLILRGLPVPAAIPNGSAIPGMAMVFAFAPQPINLRRAIVTDAVTHESFSDLAGTLKHNLISVVLNNHSPGTGSTNQTLIYEDNGQGDIAGSRPSDGPGSLRNFIGENGSGLWSLTMLNVSPTNTGAVQNLSLILEPQNDDTNAAIRAVLTNRFSYDFIDVPIGATNLSVCLSGNSSPVELYLRRGNLPTRALYDKKLTVGPSAGCLSLGLSDALPLRPGLYFIGIFNPNDTVQNLSLVATLDLGSPVTPISYASTTPSPIPDDALSYSTLFVTNQQKVLSVDVGLRVDHPRVSDLVFHLISPSGRRLLLCENRGATSTNGLGANVMVTNVLPQIHSGDFNANTNVIEVGQNSGSLIIDYDMYDLPDTLHVYYDNSLIFDSGPTTNNGRFSVSFGPGVSTELMIIMNEGNNTNVDTAWDYRARVVSPHLSYFTLTENPNLAQVPVKFAVPPLGGLSSPTNFYLPEEPLTLFTGENAFGNWILETLDNRAGPLVPSSQPIVSWQLSFVFQNDIPLHLPLLITGYQLLSNSLCLTWSSMPTTHYQVQAKSALVGANWTNVSPTINATDTSTTYCVPLPSPFRFFRIQQ